MTVLGIDPGTRKCGVAFIKVNSGIPEICFNETICTPRKISGRDAIDYVADEIRKHYLPSRLDLLAIESFDYQGRIITPEAHDMYLLIGALGELRHLAPVIWLKAGEWRSDLTGRGNLSGRWVKRAVKERLHYLPNGYRWSSQHALDATGIAIVAADRQAMAEAAGVKFSELRSNPRRVKR